jgi:hypothetical protein
MVIGEVVHHVPQQGAAAGALRVGRQKGYVHPGTFAPVSGGVQILSLRLLSYTSVARGTPRAVAISWVPVPQ